MDKNLNKEDFINFKAVFEDLFLNKSIIIDENEMRRYSQNWIRPTVYKDLAAYEEDGLYTAANEESEEENLQPEAAENNNHPSIKEEGKIVKLYEPKGSSD